MRTRRVTRITTLAASVAAAVFLGAACSDDDPLVTQEGPDLGAPETVPVDSETLDGQDADPVEVTAVVERLLDPALEGAPLGAATVRRFYSVQLLTFGFTEAEAACAADLLVKAAGPEADTMSMAELSGEQAGIDQTAMVTCVDPARLGQLQDQPPDPAAVAGAEVRGLLSDQSIAIYRAAGLTDTEAACVAAQTVGTLSDAEVRGVLDGEASTIDLLPDAVAGCLNAARLSVLADS